MAAHVSLMDYIGIEPTSGLQLAELIEKGLPTENLNFLKRKGVTFTEMAETVIAPRTLKHRKDRGENLSREESERAIRVASTIALAERVFEDPDKAMRWLRHPDYNLDNRTPISLLGTEAGGRLIESMLWGIDEGVYT